jgi:hypothetical protein
MRLPGMHFGEISSSQGDVMAGLILIAVVVIWFSVSIWLARKTICARKSFGLVDRNLTASYFITLLIAMSLTTGCEKLWLDRQMEELCQKDGGVRVYETVNLPPEMFDQNGDPFPGWRGRPSSERLGNDFEYSRIETSIKEGDPLKGQGRLFKSEIRVIRKLDLKLLGHAITYFRSGGDGIVLGHPSSSSCPANVGADLPRSVFIQSQS